MIRLIFFLFFTHISFIIQSQSTETIKWWDPSQSEINVIEGRIPNEHHEFPYDRLSQEDKQKVRKPVSDLSEHNAGIMIRFRTNAEKIIVKYIVDGNLAMNHMPATGVSGLDLYAVTSEGREIWCSGRRIFKDTLSYTFSSLNPNDGYHKFGREYRLYFPLYNKVNWLNIGVSKDDFFRPLEIRKEKPIVIYGTSIAQGGCASRPGMAWPAIVGRKLDRQVLNFGFSGNGRLEPEVIDILKKVNAKVFILDCLPNLDNKEIYGDEELKNRIYKSVTTLRKSHSDTPILLVDHLGFSEDLVEPLKADKVNRINRIQKEIFDRLKKERITKIYYLTQDELDLSLDATVDGIHPNDLGMQQYAEAYVKKLRVIMNEPIGKYSTTIPVSQYREPGNYDWEDRHSELLELPLSDSIKSIIIANSIVHFWGGLPKTKIAREPESWDDIFSPAGLRNYSYGWDRIENVLWRVYHEELENFQAEKIVIMIGTNNLHINSNIEIIQGLKLLVSGIMVRQPNSKIMLAGILPRRGYIDRLYDLNIGIQTLADDMDISYQYLGKPFINEKGELNENLFSDGLHPNKDGYLILSQELNSVLKH